MQIKFTNLVIVGIVVLGIVLFGPSAVTGVVNLNLTIDDIIQVMPAPTTREKNTLKLQSLLDMATVKGNVRIKIPDGFYELDTCYISSNTELILSKNTVLKNGSSLLFCNAKPSENTFTKYNGHGNIKISGGTILNSHFFSMIHGENIIMENIKIKDINWDHAIEIAGCKNVKIKNCRIQGLKKPAENRQYIECIQFDPCIHYAFPRFAEGSSCYDNTSNDNIMIEGCEISPSKTDGYQNLYVAIGGHSPSISNHKNIKIINNTISAASYAGIRLMTTENVTIEANKIDSCNVGIMGTVYNTATGIELINISVKNNKITKSTKQHIRIDAINTNNQKLAKNINIKENIFDTNANEQAIYGIGIDVLNIRNNKWSNSKGIYRIEESDNVTITDNNSDNLMN